jgi:hypothetical protein
VRNGRLDVTDEKTTPPTPATFKELLGEDASLAICSRCPATATHTVSVRVTVPRPRRPGHSGGIMSDRIAAHSSRLCERCAVQIFATFRKAIR